MKSKNRFPCSLQKACYIKWLVTVLGMSLTEAAIVVHVNVGTVSHVINGHRFPYASPEPMPGYQ